ncbi:hypothetical protein [Sphingobacterium tabacisoli]|uniref:HTH cro/C1-type domain-containing protein n=1 Tax=Sphingobacterium tabacisoli TaxID=2044855 RepID=A0ABW5L1Y9_9SPHI|nr:hypothetical protein [Sphingobacterium tabacisoli]
MDATNIEYLSPLDLYIIIKVKFYRLELGIPPKELSSHLDRNKNYIGNIESSAHNGKYNDSVLNDIAAYFTQKAKERKSTSKVEFSIHDFYPTDILSDNRVIKDIPHILSESGPTGTLNSLIESTDFFKTKKTLKEIVKKANEVQNQTWKGSNFTQPLENAVKSERLTLTIIDGLNSYTLTKNKKKD